MIEISSRWPLSIGLGLVLGACNSAAGNGSESGEPQGGSSEGGEPGGTDGFDEPFPGATSHAETGEQGSSSDEGSGSDTCSFICEGPPDTGECDVLTQDCPSGEKCMPWANDGGNSWNDTRCMPIADDPGQPGDACTVDGNGVSGIDDCDLGSMCWDVDPETNMGTCVAMCTGDPDAPVCEDPDTECVIANEGVLVLCLPICDPLLQDCPEGQACYSDGDVSFFCIPDASGAMGVYGDPCEYGNACDPGLFCADAEGVPDCGGSVGCCSEYCDLESEEGDAQCSGVAGGQACVPWTADPLPGFEAVGACLIPE